jgi:hypothetical protein
MKVKNVHPVTCHEGPEGKYRQLYSTFNLSSRMGSAVKATPQSLYPQERDLMPII